MPAQALTPTQFRRIPSSIGMLETVRLRSEPHQPRPSRRQTQLTPSSRCPPTFQGPAFLQRPSNETHVRRHSPCLSTQRSLARLRIWILPLPPRRQAFQCRRPPSLPSIERREEGCKPVLRLTVHRTIIGVPQQTRFPMSRKTAFHSP